MKEDFLHYVWKYQLMDISALKTHQEQSVTVITPGVHNYDTGPDFINAKVRLDHQLWVGNVEIHLKSSDWYWHQHENDSNYDAVVLHVVWDHDVEVYMKNNQVLPTLELKYYVSGSLLKNYHQLSRKSMHWIPCEQQISDIDDFVLKNWMERMFVDRLQRKSEFIQGLLKETQNDWDTVLFLLLTKNFGLNKNGEAFFKLAQSIPSSIIRKEASDPKVLEALLFGQAGFLEQNLEVSYFNELKSTYEYLKYKYGLVSLEKNQFQFFRMRPSNFPTIRIAQLSSLYRNAQGLFSKLMKCEKKNSIYELFTIRMNDFWKTHYTFSKTSKKSNKKLTQSFVDLLIINTVVPLQFAYQKAMNTLNEEQLIAVLQSLQAEKNTVVSAFEGLGVSVRSAFDSQSLLELKNNYCAKKLCLQCAIGNELLKQ